MAAFGAITIENYDLYRAHRASEDFFSHLKGINRSACNAVSSPIPCAVMVWGFMGGLIGAPFIFGCSVTLAILLELLFGGIIVYPAIFVCFVGALVILALALLIPLFTSLFTYCYTFVKETFSRIEESNRAAEREYNDYQRRVVWPQIATVLHEINVSDGATPVFERIAEGVVADYFLPQADPAVGDSASVFAQWLDIFHEDEP